MSFIISFKYCERRIKRLECFVRIHKKERISTTHVMIIQRSQIRLTKKTSCFDLVMEVAKDADIYLLFEAVFQIIKIGLAIKNTRNSFHIACKNCRPF